MGIHVYRKLSLDFCLGFYIISAHGKPQREGNNFVVPQLNWAWQMLFELIWTKNQTLLGNSACQPAGFARFSVLGLAFSRAESTLSYVVYKPLVSNYQECRHIGEGGGILTGKVAPWISFFNAKELLREALV